MPTEPRSSVREWAASSIRRSSSRGVSRCRRAIACLIVLFAVLAGSAPPSRAESEAPATPTTATAVGLLPIHGVTVDLDALASKRGEGGADESVAALQSLWDGYLKGAGFNVIGFTVDAGDLGERGAVRVARLCEWAKRNNVRIAPNLIGASEGKPLPEDYPARAASFVGKVIAELGATGAPSYAQIMLYQLGRPLNHPGSHGVIEPADAARRIKAAAEAVRAAEQASLASSGLQASPLLIAVSLDYELIRRGAIAHTELSDEHYGQSYEALRDWLLDVIETAPVEAVSVEWFPGSVSAEGVERMPDLMTKLQADAPGKLLIMDTGFSSAAGSDTAQARFYALALNNLCDLRARQGVESPFAGILWRNAVDAGTSGAKPMTPEQIARENWAERAKQLDRAWTDPKADSKGDVKEARAWLAGVQSSFGMVSRAGASGKTYAPKTALAVISRLETALGQSPEVSDALAAVKDLAASEKGTAGAKLKSRLQSAMFSFLDAFLSKTAENLFAPAPAPAPMTPGMPAALPDVQIAYVGTLPTTATVGSPVTIPVTLFNAGAAPAPDAAVYLRTAQTDLAQSSPTALSPGASTTVQLTWTPSQAAKVSGIALQAYCSNDADPQTNRAELGEVQVNAGGGGPRDPIRNCWDVGGILATQATLETKSDPGGPRVVDLNLGYSSGGNTAIGGTWQVMSAPAPSGGSGTTAVPRSAPAPSSASGPAGGASASRPITPAGSAPLPAAPVTLTLVNPFSTVFTNTTATLRVDGRAVAERSVGTLLPRQQRSVSFGDWAPPRQGTYRVQVDLLGTGPAGKPLRTSVTSDIVVGASPAVRPLTAAATPPVRMPVATRPMGTMVRPAAMPVARPPGTRPLGRPGSFGVRPAFASTVMGLSANGIVLQPIPPMVDAPVQASVQLANPGTTDEAARVKLSAGGEDLGEVTVTVPAGGTAIATGFRTWTARQGRHDFRAVVTAGTRSGEASKAVFVMPPGAGRPMAGGVPGTPGTMQAGGFPSRPMMPGGGRPTPGKIGAPGSVGAPRPGAPGMPSPRAFGQSDAPDLKVTAADIRVTPPGAAAGTQGLVQITVHNLGAGASAGGQVLLVLAANGREVGRQQFAAVVPAQGALPLQWPITVPPGVLSVTATATVAGDANPNNNSARWGVGGAPMAPRGATTPPTGGLTPLKR